MLWTFGGISYVIVLVFVISGSWGCSVSKTKAHIGPIHACTGLDFLHCAVFWTFFFVGIYCAPGRCNVQIISPESGYSIPFVILGLFYLYIAMWVGSVVYFGSTIDSVGDKVSCS